ncbi:uncharacterized protein LOC128884167 isoform X2 [Hylaeus volcanicus]|uniref:uncharacterized protein LOC128884167 isoform X2 n=1 Tax=Hylaeus volcanicus TaxID=313075 RepID=UPI0023B82612|nr:uncharacterized protein LOC128884167 isoform X2 [Hylaeus volcanicus]
MSTGNFHYGQASSPSGFEASVSRWHSWFSRSPNDIENIRINVDCVKLFDKEFQETESDSVSNSDERFATFPCTDDQGFAFGSYPLKDQKQWNFMIDRMKYNMRIVNEKSHGTIYHNFKHDFHTGDSYAQEDECINKCDMLELTQRKEHDKDSGNSDKLIPCVFSLPCNGKTAFLCGNFPNPSFNKKIPMVRSVDKFVAVLHLPRGIYYYRFNVDGKWSFIPEYPNVVTRKGQKLNVYDISNYRCKYYQIDEEYQKAKKQVFHQKLPELSQYNAHAPSLPFLLEKNNQIRCFPGNNNYSTLHSLSNRIYIDKSASRDLGKNVVCTCVTCVWRSPHMLPLSTTGPIYTTVVWITNKPRESFFKESVEKTRLKPLMSKLKMTHTARKF